MTPEKVMTRAKELEAKADEAHKRLAVLTHQVTETRKEIEQLTGALEDCRYWFTYARAEKADADKRQADAISRAAETILDNAPGPLPNGAAH
jgi:uncharacterized coiled-coil DUF342 family protein